MVEAPWWRTRKSGELIVDVALCCCLPSPPINSILEWPNRYLEKSATASLSGIQWQSFRTSVLHLRILCTVSHFIFFRRVKWQKKWMIRPQVKAFYGEYHSACVFQEVLRAALEIRSILRHSHLKTAAIFLKRTYAHRMWTQYITIPNNSQQTNSLNDRDQCPFLVKKKQIKILAIIIAAINY